MPTIVLTNFNIITATLGGFITIFALVSYLFKERFYLSEACKSVLQRSVTDPDVSW
jgi:sodium/hydrogen antiporter